MKASASERDKWLHELCNNVNSMGVATAVVRSFLESGDTLAALQFLPDMEAACERCRVLVLEESRRNSHAPGTDATDIQAPTSD